MKLISNKGKWALLDNSMIFGNVVWITEKKEAYQYHLLDDKNKEIELTKPICDYIVDDSNHTQTST